MDGQNEIGAIIAEPEAYGEDVFKAATILAGTLAAMIQIGKISPASAMMRLESWWEAMKKDYAAKADA